MVVNYLDNYQQQFCQAGKFELAKSIRKTATEIGDYYLKTFDFSSDEIGLLFGNIQSGKTGQVFGIACEAANLGFPFFLLLTTDVKLLQKQTFERAKKDLPDFAICSESDEDLFRHHGNKPVMVVLKKNVHVLREWAGIFKNTTMLRGNPLFIIDDEADAASLNTKVNKDQVSSINKYLSIIREDPLASIYLQVTGTPQSLLLQTQKSNWHPAFTQYFEPGATYLGGDFFFPNTNVDAVPDFIRFVDDQSTQESMNKVFLRHLIVSAQILLTGGKVSNCLIHPGIRQNAHAKSREELEKANSKWAYNSHSAEFNEIFDREFDAMRPRYSEKQSHKEIYNKVQEILAGHGFSVVVLNGRSADGSDEYNSGVNFVIGGTTLGRGVTFGQLNTFYYTRTSQSPQADTMWQHSRIFGYDRDPGLVTMFSSRHLYRLFAQINETNNSIIAQVKTGKPITIAYPEGLNPTRKNVLDKSMLNILVGGSNHFPLQPENKDIEKLSKLLESFGDKDQAIDVSLQFIIKILKLIKAERSFNLNGYIQLIEGSLANDPLAQGKVLVRRNRDITRATRALLSPNDWAESMRYEDQFVLTLYRVLGQEEKGWAGEPVWVPNIKLPKAKDFYVI